MSDYFDANAAWDRSLLLKIETPELLRVAENRAQGQRQRGLLDDARSQIQSAMKAQHRGAFRGEVSVELEIFARGRGKAPSAPKSVKRYLDALQGLVYKDDHQVGHLVVRRYASDHPSRRFAEAAGLGKLVPEESEEPCRVWVDVMPLRLYIADYERLFARQRDLHGGWDDRAANAFFKGEPDDRCRDELTDLYKERRREEQGESALARSDDPEFAEVMRSVRELQIKELETDLVIQWRPGPGDRPGPDFAAQARELFAAAGLPERQPVPRFEPPGTIWLPPLLSRSRKPGERTWSDLAREKLEAHRAGWAVLPAVFDRSLGLDIAIYGATATTHDIDNVAHTVLKAFEELYCGDHRGTVTSYRVYRQSSDTPGVRVNLMTDERLRQLDSAIAEAREQVLSAGFED